MNAYRHEGLRGIQCAQIFRILRSTWIMSCSVVPRPRSVCRWSLSKVMRRYARIDFFAVCMAVGDRAVLGRPLLHAFSICSFPLLKPCTQLNITLFDGAHSPLKATSRRWFSVTGTLPGRIRSYTGCRITNFVEVICIFLFWASYVIKIPSPKVHHILSSVQDGWLVSFLVFESRDPWLDSNEQIE